MKEKEKEPHTCKHCGAEEEYIPDVSIEDGNVLVGKLCDRCLDLFTIGRNDGQALGAKAERQRWYDAVSWVRVDYPAHAFPDGAGALVRQVLARVVMMATGKETEG